jgi:hypothetical protein
LAYHTITDTWTMAGEMPEGVVTTSITRWGDRIVIPSGEIRPAVRTTRVQSARLAMGTNQMGWLNTTVLVGYLAALVGMGIYFSKREKSTVENGINISATVDRETVKRCYRSIACAIKGRASSVLELLIDSSLRSRRPHDAQYHGSHCTLQAELDRRTLCDGDCPGLP